MRNGNANPQLLVGSATRWCTTSQNLYNCCQMISGMEHQKPLWNEYKALRNMSRLCVLCPKRHTFFCSTTSANQSLGGIFALLTGFLCLSGYCPSHTSETMSSKVSMEGQSIHGSSAFDGSWGLWSPRHLYSRWKRQGRLVDYSRTLDSHKRTGPDNHMRWRQPV
jgi:hypothetical protein